MHAIGYVRVSTEGQAQDGVSLAAQEAKVHAWADLNGAAAVAIFTDAGLSGKRADNRPGLQEALRRSSLNDALGPACDGPGSRSLDPEFLGPPGAARAARSHRNAHGPFPGRRRFPAPAFSRARRHAKAPESILGILLYDAVCGPDHRSARFSRGKRRSAGPRNAGLRPSTPPRRRGGHRRVAAGDGPRWSGCWSVYAVAVSFPDVIQVTMIPASLRGARGVLVWRDTFAGG